MVGLTGILYQSDREYILTQDSWLALRFLASPAWGGMGLSWQPRCCSCRQDASEGVSIEHLALPGVQPSSGEGRGSARLGERTPPPCGHSEGDARATETFGESPVVSLLG